MKIQLYNRIKNNNQKNITKIINNTKLKIKYQKCVIKYCKNQPIVIYKKYKKQNHKIYNNEL